MANHPEKTNILGSNGNYYGSLSRNNSVTSPTNILSPRRVIYCVHGKASSGCCRVLEGEIIDIIPDDDTISTHTKENTDTTELITESSIQEI